MIILLNHIGTQTIETERLILRRFEIADSHCVFETWMNNPEVQNNHGENVCDTIAETRQILDKWICLYDNDDGELVINEEEAKLVRRVFTEYLDGKSYATIAKSLMKDKMKTITGNEKWWDLTIAGMLENEKYCGDILLQKTITVGFLTHKRKENKGQAQKYMISENHQPIIAKEIFDKVQDERERRALLKGNLVGDRHKYSSKYP